MNHLITWHHLNQTPIIISCPAIRLFENLPVITLIARFTVPGVYVLLQLFHTTYITTWETTHRNFKWFVFFEKIHIRPNIIMIAQSIVLAFVKTLAENLHSLTTCLAFFAHIVSSFEYFPTPGPILITFFALCPFRFIKNFIANLGWTYKKTSFFSFMCYHCNDSFKYILRMYHKTVKKNLQKSLIRTILRVYCTFSMILHLNNVIIDYFNFYSKLT